MSGHEKRFYKREEAAEYLGISVYKIRRAIASNTLPARRNGKDIVIDVADLDLFADTQFEAV